MYKLIPKWAVALYHLCEMYNIVSFFTDYFERVVIVVASEKREDNLE